jgi:hypothetical protein
MQRHDQRPVAAHASARQGMNFFSRNPDGGGDSLERAEDSFNWQINYQFRRSSKAPL